MAHLVSLRAESDLDEIWLFVARDSGSMESATRLVESITDRFLFLANFPFAGRPRDRDFGPSMRSFPVSEYILIYSVEGPDVWILRVVHGKRDLQALFESV